MSVKPLLRDVLLLAAAAAIGWWAHGANSAVQAQRNNSSESSHSATDALGFEFGGLGPDGQLTLYNNANHTFYVYPSVGRSGGARIQCLYSVHVERAGAPLYRENCPVGSFMLP